MPKPFLGHDVDAAGGEALRQPAQGYTEPATVAEANGRSIAPLHPT